ncbi:MAG TPA: sigma-70 family RNA polymerase sigma factor [Caldilineaceae bacterium]|nr:sigma-70 family RNA polymerase sigma factor [Caldilineaceae bacterium]
MKQIRSNQQWLDELRGGPGVELQRQAHLDLANYLYVVAYNYLLRRQSEVDGLAEHGAEELAALAQDCVQDVLEKISSADFALLAKFKGYGSFTVWSASILRNHIAGLLRRVPFTSRHLDLEMIHALASEEGDLSDGLVRAQLIAALQECLDRLPGQYRIALIHCILNGEGAKSVADALQKTVGAVNLLVLRAKRQVKRCLAGKGFDNEVLGLF